MVWVPFDFLCTQDVIAPSDSIEIVCKALTWETKLVQNKRNTRFQKTNAKDTSLTVFVL